MQRNSYKKLSIQIDSIQMQKSKTEKLLFRDFCRFNSCEGLFEMKNYPAKKIRVLYNICVRAIFLYLFCKQHLFICGEFSRQKTQKKYGAQNTHAPIFLKNITNKVDIYWRVVFLYSPLLLLNKEIDQFCVIFYCLSKDHKSFMF